MQRLPLIVIVAAVILGGCDVSQPTAEVSFRTAETAYAPGSEVAVRLENRSDVTVAYYNICFTHLELERQDGRWKVIPVSLGPDRPSGCLDASYGLAPSESVGSEAFLPAQLATGRYRLATAVTVGTDRERIVTNPFEVE